MGRRDTEDSLFGAVALVLLINLGCAWVSWVAGWEPCAYDDTAFYQWAP